MFSDGVYSFTDSWFGTFVNSGVHLEDHNGHGPQVNMGKEELNIQLLLIQLVPQKKRMEEVYWPRELGTKEGQEEGTS